MEAKPTTMIDNFKEMVRSSEDFLKSNLIKSLNNNNNNNQNHSHSPVDILKRLQREAFSELMKLRDRQEKLEKMVLCQKFSKESPFRDARTYVNAAFSAIGSLLIFEDDFLESADRMEKFGSKAGVNSRLTFETVIRERDSLVAEFGATGLESLGLYRLMCRTSINDLLSLVVVPIGAQCSNFVMNSSSRKGDSDVLHASGSPIFHQYHDFAAGVTLRGLNFGASLAQLVSGPSMANATSDLDNCHFTTFSQITYKPLEDLKVSLSSLWQMRRPSSHLLKLRNLTIPLIHLKRSRDSEVLIQGYDTGTSSSTSHSVALMLDVEYLESTKLESWVEVDEPLNENLIKFGVSFCDMPENELGWGLRVRGKGKGSLLRAERFHMEGFLNFDLGRGGNAKLQPGLVYVTEGGSRVAALVLRSSWSM
ncbi:GDSL esterase/lipase [Rhynchospora pubera]|uniref:GDSL esterase/lipase n=1 Tax=Rhynchospora pubera TaxID=906938 RepID=A0AAV8GBZ2_9POAL|nr:GDSL esterase/lipase [Rhynchospora pubera]